MASGTNARLVHAVREQGQFPGFAISRCGQYFLNPRLIRGEEKATCRGCSGQRRKNQPTPISLPKHEQVPEPLWESCEKCNRQWRAEEHVLRMSFATVGIEEGMSEYQMAMIYFVRFHRDGHTHKTKE